MLNFSRHRFHEISRMRRLTAWFTGMLVMLVSACSTDGVEITEAGSQAATLVRARRLLAIWHAVHIPIGIALFTAAFIHVGAALYYATLLR